MPTALSDADPILVEELVAANRILFNQGVVDGYGHVSVRHDKRPDRYILSRSMAPGLVTAEDDPVVVLDAFDPPLQGDAETRAHAIPDGGNRGGLQTLDRRRFPIAHEMGVTG